MVGCVIFFNNLAIEQVRVVFLESDNVLLTVENIALRLMCMEYICYEMLSMPNPMLCIILYAWLDDGGNVKVFVLNNYVK